MEKLDLNESLKKINQDLVALGEKLRGLEPTLLKSKNDELKEELKHYTELADALNKKVKDQQKQITDLIQSNQKLRENETCLTDSLKRGNEQLQKSYAIITKLNEDIHKLSGKIANLTETGDYAMTSLRYASGGFTGEDKLKEKFYGAGARAGTRLSDTNPLLVKSANLRLKVKRLENALFEAVAEKESAKQELTELNSNYSMILTNNHEQAKFIREAKNELEVKRAIIQNYEKDLEGKSTKILLFDKGIKEAGYESLPDLLADHTRIKNELALSRVLQDDFNLKHNDLKIALLEAREQRDHLKGEAQRLEKALKIASQEMSDVQETKEWSEDLNVNQRASIIELNKRVQDRDERIATQAKSIRQMREEIERLKKEGSNIITLINSYNISSLEELEQILISHSAYPIAELKGRLNKQHIELNQLYRERKTYKKLDVELATTKKLLEKEEKLVATMRQKAYEYKKECEDLRRHQTPTPIDLQERERRELKTYQEQAADLVSLDNNVIKLQEHIENLKRENDTLMAQRDASDAKIYELSVELHKDAYRNELLTNLLNELSLNGVSELKDYIEKLKKDFKEYMDMSSLEVDLLRTKLKKLKEDAFRIINTTHGNYEALKNRIDSLLRP